jgi:glycosyltransferase involved in cell wall biosynthesis
MDPKVTIITPTFNTKIQYIFELFDSIVQGAYSNIEHIIIDDGSFDFQLEIIEEKLKKLNYPFIIIQNEKNLGICKSLNIALEYATGDYCCFCADDLFLADKLETEVRFLENNPNVVMYYGDALIRFNDSNNQGSFISSHLGLREIPEGDIFDKLLEIGNWIPIMGGMFRTEIIKSIGGFDENLRFEDFDLHLRLSRIGEYKYSNKFHAIYRITNNNAHRNRNIINDFELTKIYLKQSDFELGRRLTNYYFLKTLNNKILYDNNWFELNKIFIEYKNILFFNDKRVSFFSNFFPNVFLFKILMSIDNRILKGFLRFKFNH